MAPKCYWEQRGNVCHVSTALTAELKRFCLWKRDPWHLRLTEDSLVAQLVKGLRCGTGGLASMRNLAGREFPGRSRFAIS